MALDLGNLTATLEVDATSALASLAEFERSLSTTEKAMERLDSQAIDVTPKGKQELDAAGKAADDLTEGLDKASSAAGKMKPPTQVTKGITDAASAATDLSAGLDDAAAASGKIKPVPGVPAALDKSAASAAELARELNRAKSQAEQLGTSGTRGINGLDGVLGGLASTAKGLLPQITAVAAGGAVISKGWDRLTGIDTATFKLKGLGHAGDGVTEIMNSALTSVRGTAFGLGDAATAAANAVASGVKPGHELTQVLTTMADTAAISGASLNDVGMIFNSVMAKGKLQGDDLLQLMGRGVPVLQFLADSLGKTTAEISEMSSEGLISFEMLETAMRENVGGAAQEMGQSITGSLSNAGAAIGRLGEAIMGPIMQEGPAAIAGFTTGIDVMTDAVKAAYGAWDRVPEPIKAMIAVLGAARVAQMLLNTEMGKGLALKVADGYASATKGIADFSSSLTEAYRNTRLANPEMGAMSSGLTVLAGSGGVASTALGGLRGAAGSLLAALGGPWGLAIGGATVALGMFMQHVAKTKQAEEEAEAATLAWADALSAADGKITESVQKHAIAQVQAMELGDTMDELRISTGQMAGAVLDLDGGYDAMYDTLTRVIEAGTTYIDDVNGAGGYAMDETAKKALELRDALEETNGQYVEGSEKAGDAAEANNELSRKVAEAARAAESAQGGFDPLLGVFEAMSAEAKTVDDAIKNLAMSMMGLSEDPSLRLQSYLGQAAYDLEKLGKTLEDGRGGFDASTGLFDTNEQGRALHDTMLALRTSMYEAAAAQYELSQAQGMSGVEAAEAAAEAANGFTDSLEEQLQAAGWAQADIDKLIEKYSMVPGDVMTHIAAQGVEDAIELINAIDERLLHIDHENYTITVDADALTMTQEQAEALGFKWEELGDNLIQLKADGSQAENAIDELVDRTEHLNTTDNTIIFRGEMSEVVDLFNDIDGMAAELRTNPASLHVVADTERARKGIEELGLEVTELPDGTLYVHTNSDAEMQKLLNLGAETVSLPEGYIEITDSSAENMKALQALGVKTTTLPDGRVVITDNSQDVRAAIDRNLSQAVLNRAGKITLSIVRNIQDVFRRATGGSIPERATGGPIPRLAAGDRTHGGYRLPMSGPGTDRTDGILGLDRLGVPTAWVDRGEFVTNRAATMKWLRTLMAINRDDPREVINALVHELPMLANGGLLSAAEIKSRMSDMNNGAYVMGGFSPRATDCSGGVSAVVNEMLGLPRFESRMSTVTQGQWLAAKGAKPGRGDADDVVIGWYDYGGGANGHTSMRLQDGTFIESGGNTGQGFTIGGKAGSLDGRGYTHFMHFPYDSTAEGEEGFLTGDEGARTSMGSRVNYRAEWHGIDVQDGESGVGSTFGGAFNVPGLASNMSNVSVGQSMGGAGGAITSAASRAGYAGEVNALMNMRNPFVGTGTWRGELGDGLSAQITSLATQLEEQLGRGGITAQVEQALDSHTPNWDVWLRVSPETIAAFNTLGEAKAARENAAYDLADAEEELAEARKRVTEASAEGVDMSTSMRRRMEDSLTSLRKAQAGLTEAQNKAYKTADDRAAAIAKASEKLAEEEKKHARLREDASEEMSKQGVKNAEELMKATDDLAKAEAKLVQEREKEQRAIADLQRAHAEYTMAMAVAPINAILDLTSGVVAGTKAMADAFQRLDDVIQATNAVLIRHEEAQIRSAQATHGAVTAEQHRVRTERAATRNRHADLLAVQQAEWDLAMARHDANRTAGASEVDLSQARQQGIWDVFQASSSADQQAMLSAQTVAMMEAHLAMVKAEQAVREQQSAYDSQIALIELEFAQREAEVQAQYLAIATAELAAIQGEAAGIAGYGSSAMAKEAEGKAQKQGGIFGLLGSIGKAALGIALAPVTGGASLIMTGQAVAEGIGHVGNMVAGSAKEKAYQEEAQREFDALPDDIKAMIVAQRAGIPLAAAAGALMGAAGGSRDDVATVQKAVQGAFSVGLDIAIAQAQAELQAAEAKRQREEREAAAKERQNRLDELNARLEADLGNFDRENTLAEILEVARQQYQEMLQENKQLGELNAKLTPKNQAVLMQLGGAGWGDGGGDELAELSRGFAGLTEAMLDPYSSAGMEDRWTDQEKGRQLSPWLPSEEEWLAGGPVDGLPETVGDGLYAAAQAEGAVEAARQLTTGLVEAITQAVDNRVVTGLGEVIGRLTAQQGEQIGTQFTGPVTIAGAQATDTVAALAEQLARAH